MTDNSKENFLLALDVIHTELKFSILVYGAPLLAIAAKVDALTKLENSCGKFLFSLAVICLLIGLVKSIFMINIFRMWRAKETFLLSGEIYKGHYYIEAIDRQLEKLKITAEEKPIIDLFEKTQWIDSLAILLGWCSLILGILLVIWK